MSSVKQSLMVHLNKLPPIEYAQLLVPWERRLQMLGIVYYFTLWSHTQIIMLLLATQVKLLPLIIIYFIYIAIDDSYEKGGRKSEWFRRLAIWRWFADYFPARLVTEADLDANNNYIFAIHPHGIHATSAFVCFGSDGLSISKVFPGLNVMIMTLNINFIFPIYREIVLALGAIGSSKTSISNVLTKGPGHSVAIVVGGAEESLLAFSGSSDLVLAKRYGFVSMAIKHGAHLVPTYSFGENDIFDLFQAPPNSLLAHFQQRIKKITGFTIPLYLGRSIFTYNYGLFPKRRPLTVVTGKPIIIERDENPSKEKVQAIHKEYMEALRDLYDRNKGKYIQGEIPKLNFV